MLKIQRYYLRSLRLPNVIATSRQWLSTFPIRGVVKQPVNCSIFQPYDVIVVGGGHAGCEGK